MNMLSIPAEFDRQVDQLRIPPHSSEAESSVLGGLLLDSASWDRISDIITEADFYRHAHRQIFGAITALANAGKDVDVITVHSHLESAGNSEEVGGIEYLNQLAQYVPSARNIRRYADIVREKAILRRLVSVGDEISTSAFSQQGKPLEEILGDCEQKLLSISQIESRSGHGFTSLQELAVGAMDRAMELADNPNDVTGLATGFYDLDRMTAGLQAGDLVVVAARPSMGKAQPLDANVLMRNGQWKPMGGVHVGDSLASIDGKESLVTGVFPQGIKPVMRVTFSDGRSTKCCEDHLWLVHNRKWIQARVMDTKSIRNLMRKPSMAGRLWIDRASGDFGSTGDLLIDPWLMGALLGDGCMTESTVRFSKTAQETLDRVRCSLPETVGMKYDHGCDWRLSVPGNIRGSLDSNPLTAALRILGLMGCSSRNKFVPNIYLSADRDTRLGVLRGLLDTDGWVEKTGSVQFSSTSIQLAQDAQLLARSLGYWCKMRTKQPIYSYLGEKRSGETSYMLTISGESVDELFLFGGKRERCLNNRRTQRVNFHSIDVVGMDECQCISVSHQSHLYVTDDYAVTHNTALAINIAEHVAQEQNLPVAVFSMEMGAAQLANRIIGSIGRIDQGHLRTGKLMDHEWPRLTEAIEKLRTMPMHINETGGLTVTELRAKARRLARQCGSKLGLIVVDYLQLMSGAVGDSENRATVLGEITRGLKNLGKEMSCPVIALSQLNRDLEKRTDKRPMMSDLRESGAIEQDADIIMFIYRDEYYTKESCREPGVAEVIIAKQRSGPTGTVKLAFINQLTRFESLPHGYTPPPESRTPARRPFTSEC